MRIRLLAIAAVTAMGVTVLSGPAYAATESIGQVTVTGLSTTQLTVRLACTGTVSDVLVSVFQTSGGQGYAQEKSGAAMVCTGAEKDYAIPLLTTEVGPKPVEAQLDAGASADVFVDVYLAGGADTGALVEGTPVTAGSPKPLQRFELAAKNPVSVFAGGGTPYADVWFRCDRGVEVTPHVSAGGWELAPVWTTCTGAFQKKRAKLVWQADGAPVALVRGASLEVGEVAVWSPHVRATDTMRTISIF